MGIEEIGLRDPAAERPGKTTRMVRIDGRGTPGEVKQRVARVLE